MTSKLNSMTKNKSIQRIPMKHFLVIPPIGLLYYHYKSDRWTGHPTGPVQRYRSGPVWTGRDRSSVRNPNNSGCNSKFQKPPKKLKTLDGRTDGSSWISRYI